jgi:hypothetical protein
MRNLNRVMGKFNGTGAACYLCVGAIPHKVELINVTVATYPITLKWQEEMQAEVLAYGGILVTGGAGDSTTKKTTTGVYAYEGGDLLTSANQTSVAYGEGIYLGWDEKNYQADYDYGSSVNGTPINKWTFVTGLTGYWNVAKVASGNKIRVGSKISIKENSTGLVKIAYVTALSSDGEVSAEVTLSRAIGSGAITFIGGMYDLAPIALGKVTPAGVYVADTTCNVNDAKVVFDMAI